MDGAQLLRSASAGKVTGSSAVLERHAARVDDLAQAVLGEPGAPLAGAVATFVDASVRLSALEEDDPLARWLVAVTRSHETLEDGPAVMHREPVPLRGSASDRQGIAAVAQRRPAPAPEPAPPAPAVVLKVSQQRPPRRVRAEAESVPAPDTAPPPPRPDDLDLAAARERGAGESGPRASRRRLVGVVGLGLALLLGAVLLRAADIERRTALTASTSTSAGVEGPRTVVLIPPVDVGAPPAVPTAPAAPVPVPDGTSTTAPPVPTTTTPTSAGAGGVLFPILQTVGLPSVDPTSGVARGSLPLQNRGSTPLTYATRSSFGGLTVDKPTGTIAPRATTVLAVALDGAKAGEGRFAGTLTFDSSGGTEQVAVTSTVGRPPVIKAAGESCAPGNPSCSPLVRLESGTSAGATPCTTSWRYSVTIEDESRLKSVQAVANLAGRGVVLKRAGANSAGAGLWQSDVLPPLQVPSSLSFSINAVDEFDFRRSEATPRSIEC